MKKYLIALAACFACTIATPAFAFKQMSDQWKVIYAGDDANADFKKLVDEAKCNVCHVNKENKKKVRNPYGDAVHEALEKADFPVADFKKDPETYADQVKELLKKVEGEKSGYEDHKTFGDRIKANLLPGGNTEGKKE